MNIRAVTLGTTLAMASMLGTLVPSNVAHAGPKGRKNTAIGLGAAAAQQLLSGKTTNGVLLGAGAAYAYKRYKDSERDEKRNRNARAYRSSAGARNNGRYGAASRTTSPSSRLVFTGRIMDDTDYTNRRITVNSNGVERRIDVPSSATLTHGSAKLSVHELHEGDIVRVSAVRTDVDRWRALRVDVLTASGLRDDTYRDEDRSTRSDRVIRQGGAGTVREYSGVGIIQSVDEENGSFTVRVGGNTRTIFTRDSRFSGTSGLFDLRTGDRVRVQGDLDGTDVFARNVTLLD